MHEYSIHFNGSTSFMMYLIKNISLFIPDLDVVYAGYS